MTERDRSMNWPVANKNSLSKYIGPAVILALATSIFYLFGMIYQSVYFDRISFPYQSLNLPPTMYLLPIIAIVFTNIGLYIILIEIQTVYWVHFASESIKTMPKYKKSFPALIAIFIYTLFYILVYNVSSKIFISSNMIFMYMALMAYILFKNNFTIKFINIKNFYHLMLIANGLTYITDNKNLPFVNVLSYFLAFNLFISGSLVYSLANSHASDLIEGTPRNYEVKLDLNNSSCNLPGDTFILVMQQEGFLYLVKKEVPAPLHSTLYVVPATKFNYATINLITPETNPKPISFGEIFYNLTNSIRNLPNSIKPYLNNSSTRNYVL
jgi:hypothetical protein